MKWDQEFEKECTNPVPANYRATLRAVGDLDMIGVKRLKNLKIFFPAPADIGGGDGRIQDPLSRGYIAIHVIDRSQMLLSTH
jgi:hypothetical protein